MDDPVSYKFLKMYCENCRRCMEQVFFHKITGTLQDIQEQRRQVNSITLCALRVTKMFK